MTKFIERPKRIPKKVLCAVCEKEIFGGNRNGGRKYCSPECANVGHLQDCKRWYRKHTTKPYPKCAKCGITLENRKWKYCPPCKKRVRADATARCEKRKKGSNTYQFHYILEVYDYGFTTNLS